MTMAHHDDSRSPSTNDRFARLGTLALAGGLLLILARALETSHGFPAMPRFWYQNDSIWWVVGMAGVGFGSWLLARSEHGRIIAWKPTHPGRRFDELIVYTRRDCKLCDEAVELLQVYRRWLPAMQFIDIDQDPNLVAKFGTCVPVVEIDGRVRFRGRINEVLLRRLIEGATPKVSRLYE
jgi:hypothetical protein